jgi:hypothetical protein
MVKDTVQVKGDQDQQQYLKKKRVRKDRKISLPSDGVVPIKSFAWSTEKSSSAQIVVMGVMGARETAVFSKSKDFFNSCWTCLLRDVKEEEERRGRLRRVNGSSSFQI